MILGSALPVNHKMFFKLKKKNKLKTRRSKSIYQIEQKEKNKLSVMNPDMHLIISP